MSFSPAAGHTAPEHRAARRLYLKNGYREVGRGNIGPCGCAFYERGTVA
jgi:hypothetical protein